MHSSFKLLMILSTPFRSPHSRLPLEFFSFTVASRARLLSVAPSSRFGCLIRAAEQVRTKAIPKEGYSDTVTSYPGFKDSYSWPEWAKLVEHLLAKGYSQCEDSDGDEDDFMLTDGDLTEEFLRAAEACLGFARARPDILRLLTKKYMKAVVENGSPFLFKNGDKSASRMRLLLSGDESAALEPEKAQTVDIMRYLLSYMYKPFLSSNKNQLKDYESVETSVRKLLLELFNFSGTVWRSKLPEPTTTELPFGNEQLSRPPVQSIEMKRGDWICQKCTFMNFARNMNCLECGEARPKRQLTGAEWDCPQCDFFNYGRNKSCLRCDHKRPGDELPSSTPAAGVAHTGSSSTEQHFSVFKQDSHVGSSIRSGAGDTSDSISRSLDRILGRSSTPSENMSTSGDKNTSALGKFSSSQVRQNMANQRGKPDNIPFVPLPPDMFRNPQESNNDVRQSSDKEVTSSSNTSELIDSLLKSSENSLKSGNSKESSDASLRWSKTAAKLENVNDPANAVSDDDFPDIMPIRKGENRFVVSKKKDRSLTSPAYKRRLAAEQANNYNSVPFVPFPPGYFAKKDNQPATDSVDNSSAPLDKAETLPKRQEEQEFGGSTANSSRPPINNWNASSSFGGSTANSTQPSNNSWSDNRSSWNSVSVDSSQQSQNDHGTGKIPSGGYPGKSLEGSCVKELDPLDMSEEAKAERWFRRAAQIKDISELSQIPDEDFPEIMPMRKGVNRFVVSKRKTPLERRLTSPKYRRNLPIVSSEPEKDEEN